MYNKRYGRKTVFFTNTTRGLYLLSIDITNLKLLSSDSGRRLVESLQSRRHYHLIVVYSLLGALRLETLHEKVIF